MNAWELKKKEMEENYKHIKKLINEGRPFLIGEIDD